MHYNKPKPLSWLKNLRMVKQFAKNRYMCRIYYEKHIRSFNSEDIQFTTLKDHLRYDRNLKRRSTTQDKISDSIVLNRIRNRKNTRLHFISTSNNSVYIIKNNGRYRLNYVYFDQYKKRKRR